MNTITSVFEQAQLAEAAYADFWNKQTNSIMTSKIQVQAALEANDFSTAQATEFLNNWQVVDHVPDLGSGFSATVFESLDNPGQYSLAIRGSTPSQLGTDFIVDMNLITADGIAIRQLVDLYNFEQRGQVLFGAFRNSENTTSIATPGEARRHEF